MEKRSKNKSKSSDDEERFDVSKPQFRHPKQQDQKVVLDERFASVLTDERFQLQVQDKYGRRQRKKKDAKDELSEFYTIEKDDANRGSGKFKQGEAKVLTAATGRDVGVRSSSDQNEQQPDDNSEGDDNGREPENASSRIAYLTALSRGQLDVSSSSSESLSDDEGDDGADESSDSEAEVDDAEHSVPGVLDPSSKNEDVKITHEATPVLAVLNMDWSHVRAVDVFALLMSFSPPGAVKRVRVFLSDFGKEKLAAEERLGPSGIWKEMVKNESSGNDASGRDDDERPDFDEESDVSEVASQEGEDTLDGDDFLPKSDHVDSGFDPEKLRAYEASKLKYYFAIAEFWSSAHADAAYKEVDGLEFEHSSAAVDLRAIQPSELEDIIRDRELRDEACGLPSNYNPPDFVVGALQQTNLQCTWEVGDRDRERTLTKYTSGAVWQSLAESDDLKAYLASDASSDEENGSDDEKATNMRRMLGLDSDHEDDNKFEGKEQVADLSSSSSSSASESTSESENEDEGEATSKEVTFVPGQKKDSLESKIRSKLESNVDTEELTPWQKYQLKRKEKRKERRLAVRAKRHMDKETGQERGGGDDDADSDDDNSTLRKQTREELELLLAGDEHDEEARDYDMRELQRLEKLKNKKLRGSRKRKESERAAIVSGTDFKLDLKDDRFKAVLEGDDDRFGIDRTDPNYKETPAMKEILTEQARRRKSKKRKKVKDGPVAPNVTVDGSTSKLSSGAAALSALVTRIKSKVN